MDIITAEQARGIALLRSRDKIDCQLSTTFGCINKSANDGKFEVDIYLNLLEPVLSHLILNGYQIRKCYNDAGELYYTIGWSSAP